MNNSAISADHIHPEGAGKSSPISLLTQTLTITATVNPLGGYIFSCSPNTVTFGNYNKNIARVLQCELVSPAGTTLYFTGYDYAATTSNSPPPPAEMTKSETGLNCTTMWIAFNFNGVKYNSGTLTIQTTGGTVDPQVVNTPVSGKQ